MRILRIVFTFILVLGMHSLSWSAGAGGAQEAETIFMAKKAYTDGFYEVSLEILERFKNDFPHSPKAAEARILTAQCYFFQGRYLEALNILEGLLAEPGANNFKDAVYFWIAEVHFKGNNFEKAAVFLTASVRYAENSLSSYSASRTSI